MSGSIESYFDEVGGIESFEPVLPVPAVGPPTPGNWRFPLIAADDLPDLEVQWLVEDILPALGFAVLYGRPGSFKTFVALYVATMIAATMSAFGRRTRAGCVVYVAAEGAAGLKRRYQALRRTYDLPNGIPLHFLRSAVDLRNEGVAAEFIAEVLAQCGEPVLIVFDTLARNFGGGNENASEDMGAFVANVDLIRTRLGAAALIVHHTGKDESKGSRGHSSLLGAVDTELEVTRTSEDGAETRTGKLHVTKQKDGEDGISFLYRLDVVPFETPEGFKPRTSLVVVPDDSAPASAAKTKPLTGHKRTAFEALKLAIAEAGERPSAERIPRDAMCVRTSVWRQFFRQIAGLDGKAAEQPFRRARDGLIETLHIGGWGDWYWIPEAYKKNLQPLKHPS
jgi:hypothetical protein